MNRPMDVAIRDEISACSGYATEVSRVVIEKFGFADGTGRPVALGALIFAVAMLKRAHCSRGDLLRFVGMLYDRAVLVEAQDGAN